MNPLLEKWQQGTALLTIRLAEITRADLQAYADASGDNNKIHLDETFAKEAGFPSVIAHGMLSMGFLGDFIRANFPDSQFALKRFSSRFRRVTFPGEVLELSGEVKKVMEDQSLLIQVCARNQAGEVTTEGEALLRPIE